MACYSIIIIINLETYGFEHSKEGISKLLGSPIGNEDFRAAAANKRTSDKMVGILG